MMQVCLIRKSWKTCIVGVPPGTGLGNTALVTDPETLARRTPFLGAHGLVKHRDRAL